MAASAAAVVVVMVLLVMADLIGHLHSRSLVDEPFRCVLVAVEDYIFNALKQFRLDLIIDLKHRRIYNRHVQTRLDCVVKECRVHCLADRVVSTECEREVGYSAGSQCSGEISLNPANRLDEVNRVFCMFLNAGSYRQDVYIEYYVTWRNAGLLGQEPVCSFTDLYLTFICCRLALLVECHHDHCCA